MQGPNRKGKQMDRNQVISEIRTALRRRSGRAWSVTGGRGTAYGWITISAPPARRVQSDYMSERDRRELGELLALGFVHQQGVSVPASSDYYQEHIDRANGRAPSVTGRPYWD